MPTTSISLLTRLRGPDREQAWTRFVQLYTPLLLSWARTRYALDAADAEDLIGDVYAELVRRLPTFDYDQSRSFRAWLFRVVQSRHIDQCRRVGRTPRNDAAQLDELAAASGPDPIEVEERRTLVRRALQLMQADFAASTWKACWGMVAEGKTAAEMAAELGISENAVYIAKGRVLRRLRQELDGLLD